MASAADRHLLRIAPSAFSTTAHTRVACPQVTWITSFQSWTARPPSNWRFRHTLEAVLHGFMTEKTAHFVLNAIRLSAQSLLQRPIKEAQTIETDFTEQMREHLGVDYFSPIDPKYRLTDEKPAEDKVAV